MTAVYATTLTGDGLAFALGGAGFLVLLFELIDAAGGVNQLLAASEEGVAVGADFNADIALVRGTRFEDVATGADDIEFVVSGMNTGFHVVNRNLSELPVYRKTQTPVSYKEHTGVR